MAVVAAQEMRTRRLADFLRHCRRHRHLVGEAADTVRAEEFTRHLVLLVPLLRLPSSGMSGHG
jgi:hypothetical protein